MSSLLQVCLYNTESTASSELQSHISGLNFVRFVGEVNNAEDLTRALNEADVILMVVDVSHKKTGCQNLGRDSTKEASWKL